MVGTCIHYTCWNADICPSYLFGVLLPNQDEDHTDSWASSKVFQAQDIYLEENQNPKRNATAPKSDRITQPSCTFFIVPHPDVSSENSTNWILGVAVHISLSYNY